MRFIYNENIEVHDGKRGIYNYYRMLSNKIKVTEDKIIAKNTPLSEAVVGSIDEDKGGMIVLSTDVNAVEQDENKVVNFIKKKIATFKNRLNYGKMINRKAKEFEEIYAWTIGKFLRGRYKADNGTVFDENSISVEVLGVSTETLIAFAEQLCRDFKQETVLVKDYENGKILFVNDK